MNGSIALKNIYGTFPCKATVLNSAYLFYGKGMLGADNLFTTNVDILNVIPEGIYVAKCCPAH